MDHGDTDPLHATAGLSGGSCITAGGREEQSHQSESRAWPRRTSHRAEAEMNLRTLTQRASPPPTLLLHSGYAQQAGALGQKLGTDTLCAEHGSGRHEKPDLGRSRMLALWFQKHVGKTFSEKKFPCWLPLCLLWATGMFYQ